MRKNISIRMTTDLSMITTRFMIMPMKKKTMKIETTEIENYENSSRNDLYCNFEIVNKKSYKHVEKYSI